MINGIADCRFKPNTDAAVKVCASLESGALACVSNTTIPSSGLQLYFGNLHCHDFMSDAFGYTDRVYEWAKTEKRLDFLSVSVQLHGWLDNEKWTIAKYMNERFLDEGKFVTLLANEWQHTGYADKIIHFLGSDQPFFCVDNRVITLRKAI